MPEMFKIEFQSTSLTPEQQKIVGEGFDHYNTNKGAPLYDKNYISWVVYNDKNILIGTITAEILWDWMYLDELWVMDIYCNQNYGTKLLQAAESFAKSNKLIGTWLWTQSWQAKGFYEKLGYSIFTEFENFPKGHKRIGLKKEF